MATRVKTRKPATLPQSLAELVQLMPPLAIRDEVGHENTLEMIDKLMRIDRLSRDQGDYMETLVELVEAYEAKHHAIDTSDLTGRQMLRFVLDQTGLSASDLARMLDIHPTMGSKLLKGERRLTWDHAKILAGHFKLEPAVFMD
jgi:HTH-type transcriptional regulator / antitoxin HigA